LTGILDTHWMWRQPPLNIDLLSRCCMRHLLTHSCTCPPHTVYTIHRRAPSTRRCMCRQSKSCFSQLNWNYLDKHHKLSKRCWSTCPPHTQCSPLRRSLPLWTSVCLPGNPDTHLQSQICLLHTVHILFVGMLSCLCTSIQALWRYSCCCNHRHRQCCRHRTPRHWHGFRLRTLKHRHQLKKVISDAEVL